MFRSILLAQALAVNCSVLTQPGDYPICSHEFCLPNDYQKFDLPRGNITENPEAVNVQTEFQLNQVSEINDLGFWVDVGLYITMEWEEPRLIFLGNESLPLNKSRSLSPEMEKRLWYPDLYIYNLKKVRTLELFGIEFGGTFRCFNCHQFNFFC